MEALWNTVPGILNCRFTSAICFHDVLNGFWSGCWTGTSALEAKLIQQLMDRREEVLYEIFLDPLKAYEALDQDRCPEIPVTYRVGPRALQIIWVYWYQLTILDKARGYYAPPPSRDTMG